MVKAGFAGDDAPRHSPLGRGAGRVGGVGMTETPEVLVYRTPDMTDEQADAIQVYAERVMGGE